MTASLRNTARDWVTKAACRGHDPRLWFPEKTGPNSGHEGQKICSTCPVRGECKLDADSRNEPFGIWGGLPRKGTALGSPHRKTVYYDQESTAMVELPGKYESSQCIRCNKHWMNNAGPDQHFCGATKLCPECVALLPVEPWGLVR